MQDAEDEQVQEAAREGQADGDVQHVGNHVSRTGQDDLDVEKHRSDEEEGKFNRFRDSCEHGSQGCRQEQATGDFPFFRFSRAVHGQGSAGQAENHEDKFTREIPGGIGTEVGDVRRCELGEEDVLAALDEVAVDHHRAADAGLPEWQVEDVMQAEGDEGPLDDTENQRADIARPRDQAAEGEDTILDDWPDEVHGDADEHVDDGRNDGDETRPAEERQGVGQDDFMIAVVQVGDADADDDTAEDAFLKGHDAADVGNRTFQDIGSYGIVGQYFACQFEDGVGRGVHDEKGNHGR